MRGETLIVNGDPWTIVDEAPAAPLAEMVAAILEDAGFVVMVRGPGVLDDAFAHLGSTSITTTYVLVPEGAAEAAAALIAETITDYEGDELDALLARMAAGEDVPELSGAWNEDEDEDEDEVASDEDGGAESEDTADAGDRDDTPRA